MKNKCNKSEKDGYLEFLKCNFTNEEVKRRYDEIAEDLCDQLKRIYLNNLPCRLNFLLIIFLLIAAIILSFKLSFAEKP